ncbi:MAG: TonB-dependent receptor plug domain-containing protein, partial [Spongiibacteraceae bacterium]
MAVFIAGKAVFRLAAYSICTSAFLATAAFAADEIQLKTVKVQGATDGGADQGYRSETVSAVGPWQGRSLQDTPYALNVYSAELIENLQATTPDQVFRINPTTQMVRAQHENNQPRIMIRGFFVQKSFRDGVPDDQYNHTATMEDAESIEILNGLSGFLYGANNVGGVVNYVTKRSTEERLNKVAVSNLGNESWNVHGDFGGKFDSEGRFGYRVNLVEQGGDTAIKGQEIEKTFYSAALDGYLLENLWLQVHGMQYNYDVNGSQTYWYFGSGVKRPSASKIDNDVSWGQPWTNRWYDYNRYGVKLKWDVSENIGIRASYIDHRG